MRDSDRPLTVLARRYAEGEMDAREAAAFEERLAGDQAARDALCQAVQHSRSLAALAPSTPHPGYRDRVRARLRGRPRSWGGKNAQSGMPPTGPGNG